MQASNLFRKRLIPLCSVLLMMMLINSCIERGKKPTVPGWIDQERLMKADAQPENWMSLGRDFKQQQFPPLTKSETMHAAYKDILLKGALSKNGMSSFADILSETDVEALHQFLNNEQKQLYAIENPVKK